MMSDDTTGGAPPSDTTTTTTPAPAPADANMSTTAPAAAPAAAPAPVMDNPLPEEGDNGVETRTPNRRIVLVGHNLPDADPLVVEASFSDLFFNHTHDEWDRVRKDESASDEALRAGLRADAEEFATTLGRATGFILDPDELVADFLARL
jgi:hypothetical protein